MSNDIRYKVHTHWGCFSLDEASYRDYLAGKLWISWTPGRAEQPKPDSEPLHVSAEALRLRELAQEDAYALLQEHYLATTVTPYCKRMKDVSIDELCLSVRSSNGLRRAEAGTLGGVIRIMEREGGLRSVRNLGAKSEAEIRSCFTNYCYSLLSKGEKGQFWQMVLDGKQMDELI